MGAMPVACGKIRRVSLPAFAMPSITTLVHPHPFKGIMLWTLIPAIITGFFVGLATFLGCLLPIAYAYDLCLWRRGSCSLVG
jgi:hypothetical protein